MAKVTLGGEEYFIPEMNFLAVERAWPFIVVAMASQDAMAGAAAGISVIAAGIIEADEFKPERFNIDPAKSDLGPDYTFDQVNRFLKKKIKARDIASITACVNEMIKEAGLNEDESGEAEGAMPQTIPSTEIAAASLPNSSPPDAKVDPGSS